MSVNVVVFSGGYLVDPFQGISGVRDILVVGDRVAAVGKGLTREASSTRVLKEGLKIVHLAGKVVLPGLIDIHVHLREPGQEEKETVASGCAAALAGGITSLACMANTRPVPDSPNGIEYIMKKGAELENAPRIYPVGALTRGLMGEELADLEGMARQGAAAFSDDGRSVASAAVMARAMTAVKGLGMKILSHCEDPDMTLGQMNEGEIARRLGLPGTPGISEALMVARDLLLCSYTCCPLHIQHVSTAEAVELVAWGKEKGLPVTAEATPHHLLLTEEAVEEYGADAKMSPPLRSEKDRKAVVKGLKDGIIDCIATDHAPHTPDEKGCGFSGAPFGVVGLETALPALFTGLVEGGILTLEDLVERFSRVPAGILGIEGGTLSPGFPADMTVMDTETGRKVDRDRFHSRGKNTPFQGKTLKGWPVMTILGGKVVFRQSPNGGGGAGNW